MFKVIEFQAESAEALETWLNEKADQGMVLAAINHDWYVFIVNVFAVAIQNFQSTALPAMDVRSN